LFSEAVVSPGGIYYRLAHLKGPFFHCHVPTWRYPATARRWWKNADFSTLTFAACFDHNFLYRCPNELVLVALDSTLK